MISTVPPPRRSTASATPAPDRGSRYRLSAVTLLAAGGLFLAACGDDAEAVGDQVDDVSTDSVVEDAQDAADELVDEAQETADDLAGADDVDEASAEVAEALRANGLGTLASAVEQVDLEELVGDGEYTLFGPGDDAFLQLDADATADLLSDPEQLLEVLQGHVVDGKVLSTDLSDGDTITTRASTTLTVSIDGDTVMIGDATVVTPDVEVGSGVVHVIDQVILP